jgi:hypothetical protein
MIRSFMGPAIVITVGVLFLFDQIRGGYLSFGHTFPVILIVIGVISLACALASAEGHISGPLPPAPPGTTPPTPQNPFPGQGQGR